MQTPHRCFILKLSFYISSDIQDLQCCIKYLSSQYYSNLHLWSFATFKLYIWLRYHHFVIIKFRSLTLMKSGVFLESLFCRSRRFSLLHLCKIYIYIWFSRFMDLAIWRTERTLAITVGVTEMYIFVLTVAHIFIIMTTALHSKFCGRRDSRQRHSGIHDSEWLLEIVWAPISYAKVRMI